MPTIQQLVRKGRKVLVLIGANQGIGENLVGCLHAVRVHQVGFRTALIKGFLEPPARARIA